MASLKNIYLLSQQSPAKAACGHGTPFVGANKPNLHHYSLSHHPFVFSLSISKLRPIRRRNHIFSLHWDDAYATSPITFACTSASTVPSNTSPRVWHQTSHLNSSLFSCSNLSLINSWWHIPSSRSFSLCRACHFTDHFCLCSCRHNSILQLPPVILYLHCRYTFVFDAIPSFSSNFATSLSAQPPLRSEMHIQLLLPNLTCSWRQKGFTDRHGMGIYSDFQNWFNIFHFFIVC